MNCEELLRALNEYVDGEQVTAICAEFEQHLKGCNPCQVVVDNIRQTISIFKAGEPFPVPEAFRIQLQDALRQSFEEKFGKHPPSAT